FALRLTFGPPLQADAVRQAFDLFFVDRLAAHFLQIGACLAKRWLVGAGINDEIQQRDAVLAQIEAEHFGLRKKRFPAAAAVTVRFLPLDDGGATLLPSRFGISGNRNATAQRAMAKILGQFTMHCFCLPNQQQLEKAFPPFITDRERDSLQLRKGGPYWWPIR